MEPIPKDAPSRPGDPRLAALVEEAQGAARVVDPLTVAFTGEPVGLPVAGRDAEIAGLATLGRIAEDLDALGALPDRADELDRVSLVFGLRRATTVPTDGPLGSRLLERHLLVRLSALARDSPGAADSLLELVEAGPGILERSRTETAGGTAGAGHLALEAARRLPALLDACAGAVGILPVAVDLRFRVEGALGALLQAAAEDGGWLLKNYIPNAEPERACEMPDPGWAGLGLSLAELESEAEAVLAGAVADMGDAPLAEVPEPGSPASAGDVARAWSAAARLVALRFGTTAGSVIAVREAPAWLRGLLPSLALLPGPTGAHQADVLLMTNQPSAGLEAAVEAIYVRDHLPAASARAHARVARSILPAPELGEGWRAFTAPRTATSARELAWRAALALAAIAMSRGRAGIAQAAEMIAAESGVDPEQARLQAMQVAERPLAALTFLAGRRALVDGAARHGDAAVAAWLSEGALPGAVLRALAG